MSFDAPVGAYVQKIYANQAYTHECYNVRKWPGFEMVIDAVRRSGVMVEHCGENTVNKYQVILVSLINGRDWFTFISERVNWPKGNYKVVVGGSGVLNVTPFLEYADYFVLGRGEIIGPQLVKALLAGEGFQHESVIKATDFSPDKKYVIAQATAPYPHEFNTANGTRFQEGESGCKYKCFFCSYTWQRRYIGAGGDFTSNCPVENTMLDLLKAGDEKWHNLRIVGLDGLSERLRFNINKRISKEAFIEFLVRLTYLPEKASRIKIFMIVGYPTEGDQDYNEYLECFTTADKKANPKRLDRWGLVTHCTPFRAMPPTPCRLWPMAYKNFRGQLKNRIRANLRGDEYVGATFFQGHHLWSIESSGTDSLAAAIEEMLTVRGDFGDAVNIRRLALTKKYWHAPYIGRLRTLEASFDTHKLMAAYTPEAIPTRYLKTYCEVKPIPVPK